MFSCVAWKQAPHGLIFKICPDFNKKNSDMSRKAKEQAHWVDHPTRCAPENAEVEQRDDVERTA